MADRKTMIERVYSAFSRRMFDVDGSWTGQAGIAGHTSGGKALA